MLIGLEGECFLQILRVVVARIPTNLNGGLSTSLNEGFHSALSRVHEKGIWSTVTYLAAASLAWVHQLENCGRDVLKMVPRNARGNSGLNKTKVEKVVFQTPSSLWYNYLLTEAFPELRSVLETPDRISLKVRLRDRWANK